MNTQERQDELRSPSALKLKPLSAQGIPAAIQKAEHYRLLNQPALAESICLDILGSDPSNVQASVILLLALTDQFMRSGARAGKQALAIAQKFPDEYSRHYYTGIVFERQAMSALDSGIPGSGFNAYEWYLDAMDAYERAEKVRPPGNDDAVLRWNTCVRTIEEHHLHERPLDDHLALLE